MKLKTIFNQFQNQVFAHSFPLSKYLEAGHRSAASLASLLTQVAADLRAAILDITVTNKPQKAPFPLQPTTLIEREQLNSLLTRLP